MMNRGIPFMLLGIAACLVTGLCTAVTIRVGHGSGYDANTITDALVMADPGDVILIAYGIYKPGDPTYPETMPLSIGKPVSLRWETQSQRPVLFAENLSGVITCQNISMDMPVELVGLKITGGSATGSGAKGGGISAAFANIKMHECLVTENYSQGWGGGICCENTHLVMTECTIENNNADTAAGGLYLMGNTTACAAVVDGCRIIGNTSSSIGGIYIMGDQISVSVVNSSLFYNLATDVGGGGIHAWDSPKVSIYNCVFYGNETDIYGGAMTICGVGDFRMEFCTLTSNTAMGSGGGISVQDLTGSMIRNCIFWDNTPDEIHTKNTTPTVTFCDVTSGYAGEGNISADPLFKSGPDGEFYLSQVASGQNFNSDCVNAGSAPVTMCSFQAGETLYLLSEMTTRTDEISDTGMADMGRHYFDAVGCNTLGCRIEMPSYDFGSGDTCFCNLVVCNPGSDTYPDTPVFAILDIYGMYLFAPSFNAFDCYRRDIIPGEIHIDVLPVFNWPDGAGSAYGIIWYAAMTNPAMTDLFGEFDSFTFGWH